MKRDVDLLHGLQKGTLRMASDAFLIESLISPSIGNLKSQHPNLRVQVHTAFWDDMVDMLQNRQVEMILAAYPINPEEYQASGGYQQLQGLIAIGSGGAYAHAAAKALIAHSSLDAAAIAQAAMEIAGSICVYTNTNILVEKI